MWLQQLKFQATAKLGKPLAHAAQTIALLDRPLHMAVIAQDQFQMFGVRIKFQLRFGCTRMAADVGKAFLRLRQIARALRASRPG